MDHGKVTAAGMGAGVKHAAKCVLSLVGLFAYTLASIYREVYEALASLTDSSKAWQRRMVHVVIVASFAVALIVAYFAGITLARAVNAHAAHAAPVAHVAPASPVATSAAKPAQCETVAIRIDYSGYDLSKLPAGTQLPGDEYACIYGAPHRPAWMPIDANCWYAWISKTAGTVTYTCDWVNYEAPATVTDEAGKVHNGFAAITVMQESGKPDKQYVSSYIWYAGLNDQ